MNILGLEVPLPVLDWTGSLFVVISLVFLFQKRLAYWHFSNASLLPYFLLYIAKGDWMFAGLQVTYLIFGIHGLYLWMLEARRDKGEIRFNEPLWYAVTWVASLVIFAYTVIVTDFSRPWNWVQFAAVSLALVANFGTTRKWSWSWGVWIVSNAVNAAYYWNAGEDYRALFFLQFILAAMSVYGWLEWRKAETRGAVMPSGV